MRRNVVQTLLSMALPLTLAVGCAHTRQQETGLYTPSADAALMPTSARTVQRVYPYDMVPEGIIMRTTVPGTGSAEDWALGENIRGALTTERSLAPYPSQISVTVDKGSKGLVTLRGLVPSDYERERLHNRMAKVPGVLQIDDQIVVGLPPHPSETDIREPIAQE